MNIKDNSIVQKDSTQNAVGKIEDSRVFFVLKKTEKISSALFMITDVFNDTQSVLKKEIQEGAIHLLKDISRISTNQLSNKESIDKIVQSFLYVRSLVDVAEKINCISENNRSILLKEINYCIERVNELKNNPLQLMFDTELDKNDFEEEELVPEKKIERSLPYKSSYKRHIKDIKKTIPKKVSTVVKGHSTSRSEDKVIRQDKIQGILRAGGEMNVKDIVVNCDGVSSKTVQRDLNEMIKTGVVLKQGEKRWSVYKIA